VLCEKLNPKVFFSCTVSLKNNQIGHSLLIDLFDVLPHYQMAEAYSSAILDRSLLNYRIYRRQAAAPACSIIPSFRYLQETVSSDTEFSVSLLEKLYYIVINRITVYFAKIFPLNYSYYSYSNNLFSTLSTVQ
jgi:hypothetical protein